ncbi:double-stranded RNA-binding protein 1-like isoform X2 [Mangifera indica]|uniref:double-stranded RNA-binding protein 1-like isoform X2 n=1 Tax=Mangifera indica TaxID=29780 RepID=UPI001CFB52D1|nr:double-stranded RNA-binding protein 1-like isoform X2 [Mangifera indica]
MYYRSSKTQSNPRKISWSIVRYINTILNRGPSPTFIPLMAEFLKNLPQPQLPTPTPAPAADPYQPPTQSVAPVPAQSLAPAPAPAPAQLSAPVPAQSPGPAHSVSHDHTQTLAPGPAQGSSLVAESAPVATLPNRISEHLMHKNRLQEYAQRSGIQLPVYQTINVGGCPHAPQFHSTVFVDGEAYSSPNTFAHRKAAEQDAAKFALENIVKKVKDQGCPLIIGDTIFCKLILNEFAVKRNLEKPSYTTTRPNGLLPVFVSSVVFDGDTYTGEPGKNKKEAEQLAARAAIISLLGKSGSATSLSELIKSKGKLYDAMRKIKDANYGTQDMAVNTSQNSEILVSKVGKAPTASNVPLIATPKTASSGAQVPRHQFNISKPVPSFETVNFPIQFVSPVSGQPLGVSSSSSNKRRKNKKKANKKLCTDARLSDAAQPSSQTPSCSVAQ